jgi:hypothetical protein
MAWTQIHANYLEVLIDEETQKIKSTLSNPVDPKDPAYAAPHIRPIAAEVREVVLKALIGLRRPVDS